jgi:phosphodiesterase/alkaline phosphatase D-like protein
VTKTNPTKTYFTLVCIAVLFATVVAACSLAAAAPAGNIIRLALPESDVAIHLGADGMAAFSGTDIRYIGQTGDPSLPYQSVRVLLPPDADLTTVEASITGQRWTQIDGEWDVPPVGAFAIGDDEGSSAAPLAEQAIDSGRDAGIYESDALFPAEPVCKVDVQVMRGWKMAQVLYAPMAYNPVGKRVYELSGNAVEITYERTSLKTASTGIDLTAAEQVRDMTVNFAEVSGEYGGYALSSDTGRYVIITTSAIEAASTSLDAFVASKEARGFTVNVVTEGTWGGGTGDAAAENIRAWLKANYLSLNIKYVLLIGNPTPATGDVPMKTCYPLDESASPSYAVPTDFYYAELVSNDWDKDGDGRYGEYADDFLLNAPRAAGVAVGRIPYYGTIADLDYVLSKIVDYEAEPEMDISWHRNVLLPMNPSDASTPGWQLGEEIKDDALPVGWTYHRVYDEYNTFYCDPEDPGYVTGIPEDTETKTCTVANVTNAWNGSDFGAVFWWAHGSSTSAVDVMDLAHVAQLDDNCPSFTFQCSCSNGAPAVSNNLGYSLLKKGCVSTVSASQVSWYQPGQTSFAGTATNSGMTLEYAQRLIGEEMYAGDALNDLRADVSPFPYEELWMNYLDFNLYGCPAVGLYTPPLVETDDATSTTTSSARLNGSLNSLGTADSVTVSFEWGTTEGGPYPNETTEQLKTATGTFYIDRSGLDPGTTYYYRAKAVGWGTGYGEESNFTTLTEPPSVYTEVVTDLGTTWAILNGDLEDLGTADNVTVSFEWGLTASYSNETTAQPLAAAGLFSDNLTGLTAKTTYHFRAKAVGDGTAYGQDRTFTTQTIPPSVTTNEATNLATTSARLNGNLTYMGTASSVSVSFQWGTTAGGPYPNSTGNQTRTSTGLFNASLSGLSPGTTYYYWAKAVGDGTVYGLEKSFTTLTTPPSVTTVDASGISTDAARLNGNLTSLGTAASVTVSFQWGTTSDNYTYETASEGKSATGTFHFDLSGLASGTTFYYRAKAVGHGDPVYGVEKSFTTGTPPSVTTLGASGLTFTEATLQGDLTSLGGADNVTVSFLWGITSDLTNETSSELKDVTGEFSFPLGGLAPGTTYYYRAKAVGLGGPVYGDQVTFTTQSTPPSVTTNNAGNIAIYSATLNGSLDSLGTADNVSVSFEWGTQSGVYGNQTGVVLLSGTGSFSSNLGGLAPGTTFYYRAKAVGHGDTQYGSEITFSTLAHPVVSSSDASDVTTTSARLNGNLSSLGSAASVGVCFQWGAASGVYSDETTAEVKAGAGAFYSDLTGLTPGTTYYYRAKADGDGGAIYGVERSFTVSVAPPEVTTGDASDVTTDSAVLNADLVSLGTKSTVTVSFLWKVSDGAYTETPVETKTVTGAVVADLGGLAQGTTYCYKVKALGDGGPVYGEERCFTTADGAAPVISAASASGIKASRATITWTTDEPATSRVEYGLTEEYGSSTPLDTSLASSHSTELEGLKAGKVYHYRVVSTDAAGNQAVSEDGTFTMPSRSGVTPLWLWILVGIGVVAGITTLLVLLRADRRKKQTAGVA